jgi:mRNA-degrading endonuclease RelE of RelBE toxin-antitoxin system
MQYKVLVSKTFQKKFHQLQKNIQNSIRTTLKELEIDPTKSRPKCDIKLLKDTKPRKYRLRISEYRVIYIIERKEVKIIDLIRRETGYIKLD